ncbi:MAG: 2Fe-2S iron-sulfur cluster-binding protein [Candidatus Zipacnadales bacterium]
MMEEQVTLTIDGRQVHAPPEASVLEAAHDAGICIPTLCHLRDLTPTGVCRMCIVELVEGDRARVTTSCTLRVKEGMIIRANSPKIRRLRRNIAELLLAEAPNSKAIQDLAVRVGVKQVRYPFHTTDCVQCGRCIRICEEHWQRHALGFVGRGNERRVQYPFGKRPDFCLGEEACVAICPMTVTPCIGQMPPGEPRLCGLCEAQNIIPERIPGECVRCELGKSFRCSSHDWRGARVEFAKVR